MARMLRDKDSTDRHLTIVRRHMRRCKSRKETQHLAERIAPVRQALIERRDATMLKLEQLEDARDDHEMIGLQIADEVRNVASRAEEYDRNNLGENTLNTIIPSGRFGDLIRSNGTVDSTQAESLASRAKSLGDAHPLASYTATLIELAEKARVSKSAIDEMLRQFRLSQAEEEVAQANLRDAYEDNYLDARKQLRKFAERFFPCFDQRRRTKRDDTDESDPQE